MRKIVTGLVVLFILLINSNVYAICDKEDINRLKEIAKNVEVSYEHSVSGDFNSDDPNEIVVSNYYITVAGLTDEMYIVDNNNNEYYYSDVVDGVVNIVTSSGDKKIYIYSKKCLNILLDTRTFNLPTFNFNSMSDECKKEEFKELDICKKFLDDKEETIQGEEFKEKIEEEKKKNQNIFYKIKDFIVDNVIYTSIGMIVILVIVILLFIRHKKRSVLE